MKLSDRIEHILRNDNGMTANEIAAALWPLWRTKRGQKMTAAAVGVARKALREMASLGIVVEREFTSGKPFWVLASDEDDPYPLLAQFETEAAP